MPAFLVNPKNDGEDFDYPDVVFAADADAVKRRIEEVDDAEYFEITRKPMWDKYESTGMTTADKLAEGWWFECGHCGRNTTADGRYDEEEDADTVPVVEGTLVYCSEKCQQSEHEDRKFRRERKELTERIAKERLGPEIAIEYASGSGRHGGCVCETPEYPGYVDLRFPGGLGSVSGCPHCNRYHVQHRDCLAWEAWRAASGENWEAQSAIKKTTPEARVQ